MRRLQKDDESRLFNDKLVDLAGRQLNPLTYNNSVQLKGLSAALDKAAEARITPSIQRDGQRTLTHLRRCRKLEKDVRVSPLLACLPPLIGRALSAP